MATNNSIMPIAVGDGAENPAVNSTTNTIYVTNILDNTVSVIGGGTSLQLINITPCRVVDTRGANGDFGGPTHHGRHRPQLPHSPRAVQHSGQRRSLCAECHGCSHRAGLGT